MFHNKDCIDCEYSRWVYEDLSTAPLACKSCESGSNWCPKQGKPMPQYVTSEEWELVYKNGGFDAVNLREIETNTNHKQNDKQEKWEKQLLSTY